MKLFLLYQPSRFKVTSMLRHTLYTDILYVQCYILTLYISNSTFLYFPPPPPPAPTHTNAHILTSKLYVYFAPQLQYFPPQLQLTRKPPDFVSTPHVNSGYKTQCAIHSKLFIRLRPARQFAIQCILLDLFRMSVASTEHKWTYKNVQLLEGKGKLQPRTGHEVSERKQRYSSTLSLTSSLVWGDWLTPRPAHFTPWKGRRYPLYRRLGEPQGQSRRTQKIAPLSGYVPRTVQSVASR